MMAVEISGAVLSRTIVTSAYYRDFERLEIRGELKDDGTARVVYLASYIPGPPNLPAPGSSTDCSTVHVSPFSSNARSDFYAGKVVTVPCRSSSLSS